MHVGRVELIVIGTSERTYHLSFPTGTGIDSACKAFHQVKDPLISSRGAHRRKRSQAVASGRKRLRCPFLAKTPLFAGSIVLWLVTPLRTYFLVLFAMKVAFTTFLF